MQHYLHAAVLFLAWLVHISRDPGIKKILYVFLNLLIESLISFSSAMTFLYCLKNPMIATVKVYSKQYVTLIFVLLQAEANMKKYGKQLMNELPDDTTRLLTSLCTDWMPKGAEAVSC